MHSVCNSSWSTGTIWALWLASQKQLNMLFWKSTVIEYLLLRCQSFNLHQSWATLMRANKQETWLSVVWYAHISVFIYLIFYNPSSLYQIKSEQTRRRISTTQEFSSLPKKEACNCMIVSRSLVLLSVLSVCGLVVGIYIFATMVQCLLLY